MDEKSYLAYTLKQTDNPTSSGEPLAIGSVGDDVPVQPLFSCPAIRIKFVVFKLKKDDYNDDDVPLQFNTSPHFPSTRSRGQQGESFLDYDEDGICKLPVVPLFWCNNRKPSILEFECGACLESMASTSYYACLVCEKTFHKECVESTLEIRHPSHPFHSLKLYNHLNSVNCVCCETTLTHIFYHCTMCNYSMHPTCAMRSIPIVLDHPKSHPHPLTFFPRQASLACNICSLVKNLNPTYICTQCVFVIHKDCIGFPHVIRISRHNHRVSFTSSLPSGYWSCGVCRKPVDDNYGAYSCNKCDSYFVHSKCALHEDVWDGIELDGVPEEDDEIDDGEPFERIAAGIIRHISHSHHLRLEIIKAYDNSKFCRGCALTIYEGEYYSCMECDFILHGSCANSPRMKRHPLYPRPLTLNFATLQYGNCKGLFSCEGCKGKSNGFVYESRIGSSGGEVFQLDLRCASVSEPFEYQGHMHPLFLALYRRDKARCQMCKRESYGSKLSCMDCNYIICFSCATLPYNVPYKHDNHFLEICDGKEASDQPEWCEVCESRMIVQEEEGKKWVKNPEMPFFYGCNDCCIALHVSCLLGKDIYIRPGTSVTFDEVEYRILLNSSFSRPICNECMCRCSFPILFKGSNTVFCSTKCIPEKPWWW